MPLLVAFVNRFFAPDLALGILDTESGAFRWLAHEDYRKATRKARGINGLMRWRGHWLLGLQAHPTRLLVLDAAFRVVADNPLPEVRELHSVCPTSEGILTVGTDTDEVYCVRLNEAFVATSTELWWRPDDSRASVDLHHINSAATVGERVLLTMFGKKEPGGWRATRQGRLFEPKTGKVVHEPLFHPHTAHDLDGRWAVCESGAGRVHIEGGEVIEIGGYVRGLAHDASHLYVGVSGQRLHSRSEGTRNVDAKDSPGASCQVVVIERATKRVVRRLPLAGFGTEIFDLAPVDAAELPRDLPQEDAQLLQINSLQEQILSLHSRMEAAWVPPRLERQAKIRLKQLKRLWGYPRGLLSR